MLTIAGRAQAAAPADKEAGNRHCARPQVPPHRCARHPARMRASDDEYHYSPGRGADVARVACPSRYDVISQCGERGCKARNDKHHRRMADARTPTPHMGWKDCSGTGHRHVGQAAAYSLSSYPLHTYIYSRGRGPSSEAESRSFHSRLPSQIIPHVDDLQPDSPALSICSLCYPHDVAAWYWYPPWLPRAPSHLTCSTTTKDGKGPQGEQ